MWHIASLGAERGPPACLHSSTHAPENPSRDSSNPRAHRTRVWTVQVPPQARHSLGRARRAMLNQEGSHVDDETVLRFQQLGFGEEEIRTALLCFEGDVERTGSWLLEQPREPTRELLAPQPLVPPSL